MQPLVIYPNTKEQLKAIKAVLKVLEIKFEIQPEPLPKHIIKSFEKSMSQYEAGLSISLKEFEEKYLLKR